MPEATHDSLFSWWVHSDVNCMFKKGCKEETKVIIFQKILKETQMKKNQMNLKKMSCYMKESMTWFKKTHLSHCIHSLTLQNYFTFAKFWNVALQRQHARKFRPQNKERTEIYSAIIWRRLRKFKVKYNTNWWKMRLLLYQGKCFILEFVCLMI